jgi:hypothetical protein
MGRTLSKFDDSLIGRFMVVLVFRVQLVGYGVFEVEAGGSSGGKERRF